MLYDDIVAEFRWSPEQMSAPFDLHAANELVRKRIESRRGSAQAKVQQDRTRSRQKTATPGSAGNASTTFADNRF